MPTIIVDIVLRGPYYDQEDLNRVVKQPMNRNDWLEVHADQVHLYIYYLLMKIWLWTLPKD